MKIVFKCHFCCNLFASVVDRSIFIFFSFTDHFDGYEIRTQNAREYFFAKLQAIDIYWIPVE